LFPLAPTSAEIPWETLMGMAYIIDKMALSWEGSAKSWGMGG
jgi:hypothetical protein